MPVMAIRLTQVNTTCRVQLAAKCPRYCGHLSQADTYHAHFIQPWVGNAGGRLTINKARHCTTRPFHPSRVGFADARLSGDRRYGLERRCPTLLPMRRCVCFIGPDADRNWNALSLPFVVGPHGRIGKLDAQALTPPQH